MLSVERPNWVKRHMLQWPAEVKLVKCQISMEAEEVQNVLHI